MSTTSLAFRETQASPMAERLSLKRRVVSALGRLGLRKTVEVQNRSETEMPMVAVQQLDLDAHWLRSGLTMGDRTRMQRVRNIQDEHARNETVKTIKAESVDDNVVAMSNVTSGHVGLARRTPGNTDVAAEFSHSNKIEETTKPQLAPTELLMTQKPEANLATTSNLLQSAAIDIASLPTAVERVTPTYDETKAFMADPLNAPISGKSTERELTYERLMAEQEASKTYR